MDEYTKFLDELKQKADIIDIVNLYSPVQRRGINYFSSCPFHIDKSPSLCIYPNTNSFYCFSCHASGDVIKFVEEVERTDFKGAVEFLAKKYNMEIPTYKGDNSVAQAKKKRDRLHALMRDAALHYNNNLFGPKGQEARDYLAKRGLSKETIVKFGLGYSIDKYDLPKFLKDKGYTYEEMEEAKVAFRNGKGVAYDPQFGRFVTPIINGTKNVVAFGGRILVAKQDNVAKYYNSMESFIFHKSNEIFGQHIVKQLRGIKDVILVEGYMDVISLYQAGIENAVASMGTALTPTQAHIIHRYAEKVYFMYDGDEAGQKNMLRGVDILKKEGLDVKVVVLTEAKDPDEFIQKFGAKAMKDKIYTSAIPMYEYKINHVAQGFDLKSPEERGQFAAQAIDCIKEIPNVAQAEPLIDYIQAKSGVSKNILLNLFASVQKGEEVKAPIVSAALATDNFTKALRYIIFAAYGGVDGVTVKDEYSDCILNAQLSELYENFRIHQGELTLEDLEEYRETNAEANAVIEAGAAIADKYAKKNFDDSRKLVLLTVSEEKLKQLNAQLNDTKDSDEVGRLLVQINELSKYIKAIKRGELEG